MAPRTSVHKKMKTAYSNDMIEENQEKEEQIISALCYIRRYAQIICSSYSWFSSIKSVVFENCF